MGNEAQCEQTIPTAPPYIHMLFHDAEFGSALILKIYCFNGWIYNAN
jgi:hypothetical protein